MILNDLRVGAFGAWRDFELDDLSPGLTVFYGPNETGKTSLLQFVRSMLYGFSSAQRHKYVPPRSGVRAGGSLGFQHAEQTYRVERWFSQEKGGPPHSTFELRGTEQLQLPPETLTGLLQNIDEAVYQAVFALGLRELQELATLTDLDVAHKLYRLTTGPDQVSPAELRASLEERRARLLGPQGQHSQAADLALRRGQILDELAAAQAAASELAAKRTELEALEQALTQSQVHATDLEQQVRGWDVLAVIHPLRHQQHELRELVAALGPVPKLPRRAAERTAKLTESRARHEAAYQELVAQTTAPKVTAADQEAERALVKLAPRLSALREQLSWMGQLATLVSDLDREAASLDQELVSFRQAWGLTTDAPWPTAAPAEIAAAVPLGNAAARAHGRFRKARSAYRKAQQTGKHLTEQVTSALPGDGEPDPQQAAQEANERVEQLRRRVQLEERLRMLDRQRLQFDQQTGENIEAQLLPPWAMTALGALFAVGVMFLLGSLVLPSWFSGWIGWTCALLGLGGLVASVGGKLMWDQTAEQRVEQTHRQRDTVLVQIVQAQEEARRLDALWPQARDSFAERLQEAEAELHRLEKLIPVETRRQAVTQAAGAAKQRVQRAFREWKTAEQKWHAALDALKLPTDTQPAQLAKLGDTLAWAQTAVQRSERVTQERARHEKVLEQFHAERELLFAAAGLEATDDPATDFIQLEQQLHAAKAKRQAYRRSLQQRGKLQLKLAQAKQVWQQSERRWTRWLKRCGLEHGDDLATALQQVQEAAELAQEQQRLDEQVRAALEQVPAAAALVSEAADLDPAEVQVRRTVLTEQLERARQQVHAAHERRGQLQGELAARANPDQIRDLRVELARLEARQQSVRQQAQVVAVTTAVFDVVRHNFEQQRQPESLRWASEYFSELTGGRYRRVWVPLDGHQLRIDDKHGATLPVEELSCGTREQLFLSLRLAIIRWYAEQGIRLPLVFDDVLVNCDQRRAERAAGVLNAFCEQGHQLLFFTCHDHISKLFRGLKAPVRKLPVREEDEADEPAPKPRSKKSKKVEVVAAPVDTAALATAPTDLVLAPAAMELVVDHPAAIVPDAVVEAAVEAAGQQLVAEADSNSSDAGPGSSISLAELHEDWVFTDEDMIGPFTEVTPLAEESPVLEPNLADSTPAVFADLDDLFADAADLLSDADPDLFASDSSDLFAVAQVAPDEDHEDSESSVLGSIELENFAPLFLAAALRDPTAEPSETAARAMQFLPGESLEAHPELRNLADANDAAPWDNALDCPTAIEIQPLTSSSEAGETEPVSALDLPEEQPTAPATAALQAHQSTAVVSPVPFTGVLAPEPAADEDPFDADVLADDLLGAEPLSSASALDEPELVATLEAAAEESASAAAEPIESDLLAADVIEAQVVEAELDTLDDDDAAELDYELTDVADEPIHEPELPTQRVARPHFDLPHSAPANQSSSSKNAAPANRTPPRQPPSNPYWDEGDMVD